MSRRHCPCTTTNTWPVPTLPYTSMERERDIKEEKNEKQ